MLLIFHVGFSKANFGTVIIQFFSTTMANLKYLNIHIHECIFILLFKIRNLFISSKNDKHKWHCNVKDVKSHAEH